MIGDVSSVIVTAGAVLTALAGIIIYNRLVALRQTMHQAGADIDVQLKLRTDLVDNLVAVVQAASIHEQQSLTDVITARSRSFGANTAQEKITASQALTSALANLFAVAEAYPDLKANASFLELQGQIESIEQDIVAVRRYYNNTVGEYNIAIEQFPALIVARMFGFQKEAFLDIGDSTIHQVPDVNFRKDGK